MGPSKAQLAQGSDAYLLQPSGQLSGQQLHHIKGDTLFFMKESLLFSLFTWCWQASQTYHIVIKSKYNTVK